MTDARTWVSTDKILTAIDAFTEAYEARSNEVLNAHKEYMDAYRGWMDWEYRREARLSRLGLYRALVEYPIPQPYCIALAGFCRQLKGLCEVSSDGKVLISAEDVNRFQSVHPEQIDVDIKLSQEGKRYYIEKIDAAKQEAAKRYAEHHEARRLEIMNRPDPTPSPPEDLTHAQIFYIVAGAVLAGLILFGMFGGFHG